MFGLLGPNGAGKSTLMRTIATLQNPTEGRIRFEGVDIARHPQIVRENLGYLPQEFGVYPKISAYDLLDHLAVLKGILNKKERRQQVEALLERTNLYAHRKKAAGSFSGGMRRRFGIAQTLLGNPRLIIVDEPTAGLDPEERNRFLELLGEIGENIVVILSTHIVEDVRDMCTRMAILCEGRVIGDGHPAAMIAELKGKVWQRSAGRNELAALETQHLVLSTRPRGGRPRVRVLCDSMPQAGFEPAEPGLEDVYFAKLKKLQEAVSCS